MIRVTAVLAAVIVSFTATSALAEFMTVHGEDLVAAPSDTTATMTISVENPTDATALLVGWKLGLKIVPDVAATGTVRFSSGEIPATNYLLAGRSGGLAPAFSGPTDSISVIGDTDSQFSGVAVPVSGSNLLTLGFQISADALGTFHVAAVPGEFTGSSWTRRSPLVELEFANVPFSGGNVSIGSLTVEVVPEPGAITMLLSGGLGIFFLCRRRRFGGRQ